MSFTHSRFTQDGAGDTNHTLRLLIDRVNEVSAGLSTAGKGSVLSFVLHGDDIAALAEGKAFALPPSPTILSGFSGRMPAFTPSEARTLGNVIVSQMFWQSGAFNTGTITLKCLVDDVADAATLALVPATANPLTSAAFAGIAVAAGSTLGFTADFDATLDAGGLLALNLVVELL